MSDDNDEERLRELMRVTEQHADPIPVEQFGMLHPDRRSHRRGALVCAAVMVLLVAGGGLAVSRLGSRSNPADAIAKPAIGAAPTRPRQDQLAKAAPCQLVNRDQHPATRAQVASFRPVAAVLCTAGLRRYPGDGEWTVQIRRVATDGLSDAAAALTRPDQHSSSPDQACASIGYGPLMILLADHAGRYLHPRAPVDACGAPQPEVENALNRLRWRTVSVVRLARSRTQASLDSRCEMEWKNELSNEGDVRTSPPLGEVFAHAANAPIRVCIYRTGTDILGGRFQRGLTLSGAKAQQLRSALSGAAPIGACQAQHDFATVWAGRSRVNVEFGGCWRVLRVDGASTAIGTADADVLRKLFGLG